MEFEKLQDILGQICDVKPEKIKLEKSLVRDLGADDMDLLQILMAVELQFELYIEEKEIRNWKKVSDIWDRIQSK